MNTKLNPFLLRGQMLNIRNANFPLSQYCREIYKKELIVLHHTVSSGSAESVANYWATNTDRVATAFVVDKNGGILQVFDPKYWAYHIGKGSTIMHNKRSIGIEIVNEGILTDNGKKWTFGNYSGEVVKTPVWRGGEYWAAYTPNQIQAVAELVNYLCAKFQIKKDIITDLQYKPEYLNHCGIASHHNLRPDKTDVSPAFNFASL